MPAQINQNRLNRLRPGHFYFFIFLNHNRHISIQNAWIASSHVAESLVKAAHWVTRTRHAHRLTAVAVYILQQWANASFLDRVRAFHSRSSAFKSNTRRRQMSSVLGYSSLLWIDHSAVYPLDLLRSVSDFRMYYVQFLTGKADILNVRHGAFQLCSVALYSHPRLDSIMHTHKNTETLFLITCPSVIIVCSKRLAFLKGVRTTDR